MLEQKPKYKRVGFFDTRYFLFFFLDVLIVLLIGFLPAKIIFGFATVDTSWALMIFVFCLMQIILYPIVWAALSTSFRVHHVRGWWMHLGLNLFFAYILQAGMALPIWEYLMMNIENVNDDNAEAAAYLAVAWMSWAICAPLIIKSLGLWTTCHEALRVHYPGKGWGEEKKIFFQASSGKQVQDFIDQKNTEGLRALLKKEPTKKPFGLLGYTQLTLTQCPDAEVQEKSYLHLKDVFLSGTILWDRKTHRTLGFSRLHHVELSEQDVEHLKIMLPELK